MQNRNLTRRTFILKLAAASSLLGGSLIGSQLWAAPRGKLTGAKLSGNPNELTIALMLSAPVRYKVFALDKPDRIVIDLDQTSLDGNLKQGKHDRPPLSAIRYASRAGGDLRVVLDMTGPVDIQDKLSSVDGQHVLNLTLRQHSKTTPARETRSQPSVDRASRQEPARTVEPPPQPAGRGNFIVAIDPGHGGHDPGAIGRYGTREKDVVLAVARKLKARIDSASGMRAVLTRSDDSYVPLRQRMDIARQSGANLFISVHADANNSSHLHGSSVYILSENGASSEAARLLADSENSYEIRLGDLRLSGNSSKIASILLDLSQNATMDSSLELAKRTLRELTMVSNPLRRQVESAGFVVLKAPDIPSILVETAFISNPTEERRLQSDAYQQQLADAIFKGVRSYQQAFHPSSMRSQYARGDGSSGQYYVVRSGDSLSVIADRHGIPAASIRRANNMSSSTVRVGQKLKIPTST